MAPEFAWLLVVLLVMETAYKMSPKTKYRKLGWVALFLVQALIVYWFMAVLHGRAII